MSTASPQIRACETVADRLYLLLVEEVLTSETTPSLSKLMYMF
jgi:hypothetical protein